MNRYVRICALSLFVAYSINAESQTNGSNSSYSRFGLGTLNDQSQSFNKGMAGVGLGLRTGQWVNMANPASYSAIDSLSFIFDAGMNFSLGHLSQNGNSVNVRNCNIDFVNAGLRLSKGLGLSFGFVPFSTIGYSFSSESKVTNEYTSTQPIYSTSSYKGDGGLHQIYLGVGWNPFDKFSVGINASYLWGEYNHNVIQSFSEDGTSTASGYSALYSNHQANISTYKLDLGVQYPIEITPKDILTIGATAGIGHKIGSDVTLNRYTSGGDSLQVVAEHPFDMPYTFGVGAGWQHGPSLLVAADIKMEQWAACHTPQMKATSNSLEYSAEKGAFKNRTKISAGAQYVPNPLNKRYFDRIQYRIGAHYSTPYLKINGLDGPQEYGLTMGLGLPITNNYNNRSVFSVCLQWLHRAPSSNTMISENYFMINVGMTFNERWFSKFKIN